MRLGACTGVPQTALAVIVGQQSHVWRRRDWVDGRSEPRRRQRAPVRTCLSNGSGHCPPWTFFIGHFTLSYHYLNRDRNHKFILQMFSLVRFLPSLPSFFVFPLFRPPRSGSLNPANGFDGALLASTQWGENNMQPLSYTFPRTAFTAGRAPAAANAFLAYIRQRVWCCKCRSIFVKRNLKTDFLYVLYVTV